MNNSAFRKLVNDTPRVDRSSAGGSDAAPSAPSLGSRQRASIPMTPRSVGFNSSSNAFAQQAAAYRLQQNPPKEKKFKSAAPLGSKLPQGYVDRAKLRDADGDNEPTNDDAERRLAALMELVEEGSLTREEAIEQSKAFGGDLRSTHLVKGLDFKLLERARKGEDVTSGKAAATADVDEDMDDELDKALEKDVEVVKRQKRKDADDDDDDAAAAAPKKKTRAEILAEWKKTREEAAAKKIAETALGSKFKKIAEKVKKPKPSKDDKVTSNATRPSDTASTKKRKRHTDETSKPKETVIDNGTVLGILPPDLPSKPAVAPPPPEDEDVNIFDDAPDDYDPLADLQDSDASSSDDESELQDADGDKPARKPSKQSPMPPPPAPSTRPKNYFSTSSKDVELSTESIASKPLSGQDLANTAELQAAIKKAAQMRELSKADLDSEEAKKEARHKAMLAAAARDDEDVDMGFGDSRTFGDDEEEDLGVGKKRKNKKKKA
ncbi:hypothetical protein Dda_3396 [Drechslerella dactyloides]|uniref:RED-like N-terminal domain-containing protein n=1 Tax=Drechslerella dactyloides TaxID=74499 RepID=A0AAD6NLQ8_DREDA|nr:hypothetical protein Dda_3396 [Drechslerella dactyloides]